MRLWKIVVEDTTDEVAPRVVAKTLSDAIAASGLEQDGLWFCVVGHLPEGTWSTL